MQVLVIDTHSSPTGVAIVEDEELVGEISIYEEYSQSDHLLPLIQDLFLQKGLSPCYLIVRAGSPSPTSHSSPSYSTSRSQRRLPA